MATIRPFPALRPRREWANRICELPYDVMSAEEALALAGDNPLSFLHVSRAEIDLPPGTGPYAPEVYAKAQENFQNLIRSEALRQDTEQCFYLYRQVLGPHSQVGLVAVASCEDYLRNVIKRHELTRPDKEDDRTRHIEALNAQTGPVFLTYRAVPAIDEIVSQAVAQPPDVDFTARDGVRHSAWSLRDAASIRSLETQFASLSVLHIADGHHRCAAAARVYERRRGAGHSAFFLAVIVPHNQVQILPYNRVLTDLNGRTREQLLTKLEATFVVAPESAGGPARQGELRIYLQERWYALRFQATQTAALNPIERLDVTLLQQRVLTPIFGINDPRTSRRLDFVGGIRGIAELEKLVDSGRYACAFSLFPTSIEDLMAIAEAGALMPPKSTWFEPKLRDAMFCHLI
jgi:uncharacterized protein (DUF1015 family)